LDNAISASKIIALSSGEFINPGADKPDEKIKINIFYAEIINDAKKMNEEVNRYKDIEVVSNIIKQPMQDNYNQVKMEVTRYFTKSLKQLALFKIC
jgi:hypothetical protein